MIETIKTKIWQVLQRKDVSLAMVYDADGHIVWHRGRTVRGSTVRDAEGFSRTLVLESLSAQRDVTGDDVLATSAGEDLPRSARMLRLRSVAIRALGDGLFLYVDSGTREGFDDADRGLLAFMGELLAEGLADIRSLAGPAGGLSGTSAAIADLRSRIARYALESDPVLLTGETGVGKNRVAELLHRASGRRGTFVSVHTPSIPEGLLESELFGHRKGAFTGAVDDLRGLVEEAQGGTLFLDEIGETPAGFQAKLLRFVETRRYRVVGDPKEREADIRLIAATNRPLDEEVKARRFREDLYFRLSVLRVDIPPLRERPEDVRALVAEHERSLRGVTLSEAAWETLLAHTWPGNVRELCHVLTRAGVDADGPMLGTDIREYFGTARHTETLDRGGEEALSDASDGIAAGRSFWDTVWARFLARDLSRREVQRFLAPRFEARSRSLRRLAASLNIPDQDYARFVSALHKYDIHPGR
jgi:DNA-binding NtrC family response regulator